MTAHRYEISLRVLKMMKYFSTREEKFPISKRPCNVLFIILTPMKYQLIAKGAIYHVTIAAVIFSRVKIGVYIIN